MLQVEHVSVRYGEYEAVDDLSFSLEEGQWLMLIGPNGAGKSSLIECIARGVSYSGKILLQGKDIRTFKPVELARQIGVLSQKNAVGYAYSVEEIVSLGRYAHASGFLGVQDGREQIERALEMTGLTELRQASVLTLSGGELQRTFLAQVLAQDPRLLILDEPANHLDLVYQKQIFSTIRTWLQQPGRAVLSVVHDLSLARRYGTHAVLMNHGRCEAAGDVTHVFTAENLNRAYGMDVQAWMRESLDMWR